MYHRADLGSVQTGMCGSADDKRNAFALECHDLGGSTYSHVFFIAVPKRDQDVTVLDNEDTDGTVLFGAFCRVAAYGLGRVSIRIGHYRRGDSLRQQLVEFSA